MHTSHVSSMQQTCSFNYECINFRPTKNHMLRREQVKTMLFNSILSSPLDSLLPEQALQLANIYLENANKATHPLVTLVLCHDTEVSLSQAKKSFKRLKVPDVRQGIATAYDKLGELLDNHRLHDEAEAFRKKAVTVGYVKEHCVL